jgi:anti-sigma-K factor RskA
MSCEEIRPRLDSYVDGDLGQDDRRQVEAHLAGCETCRAEAEAIRSIKRETAALPRRIDPMRDLWPGIEPRLGHRHRQSRGMPRLPGAGRTHPVWRLAAAIVLFTLGAAAATLWLRQAPAGNPAFTAARDRYATATAELVTRFDQNPGALLPQTRVIVRQNLDIVDTAIREAEAALAADPGNGELERMLLARYEQRLALLQRANRLAQGES